MHPGARWTNSLRAHRLHLMKASLVAGIVLLLTPNFGTQRHIMCDAGRLFVLFSEGNRAQWILAGSEAFSWALTGLVWLWLKPSVDALSIVQYLVPCGRCFREDQWDAKGFTKARVQDPNHSRKPLATDTPSSHTLNPPLYNPHVSLSFCLSSLGSGRPPAAGCGVWGAFMKDWVLW